jgi:hypothetical protein
MTATPALQIALDCVDPHAQAEFWAAALGYEVEQDEELIRRLLDEGAATEDDVMTVDGRLAWRDGAAMSDPTGARPRWFFQLVPETKSVKNRMHVDVRIDEVDRAATIDRLVEAGASVLYEGRQGPNTWVTMADPEGNEFCVA